MTVRKGYVPAAGETDPKRLADAVRQLYQNAGDVSTETNGSVGIGTTPDVAGWGFAPTLTIYGATDRGVLEFATNKADAAGNTIGAIIFTNAQNTAVGASKLSFLIQGNTRNYSGGGANDRSSDLTFTAYNPSTDAFQQVFTIGSTNGVGCILIDTEGPHGINTDENLDAMIYIGGNATKATGASFGAAEIMRIATQTNMPVGMDGRGITLAPRFVEAGSGTHGLVASLFVVGPDITNAAATTTVAASQYIANAPTGGATNYALFVDAGLSRFDGGITSEGGSQLYSGTAVPAGGTAGAGLKFSSTSNLGVFFGSGAPTLSAAKGSLYLCTNGSSTSTRMYVNTDGGTTWTAVTTAA
jgi:hypothetical protein